MALKQSKIINLALQGGGSHGAFTWGVLDCLLEDRRIELEGISGTSSGAMNAALLASGLAQGGNDQARAVLRSFWEKLAEKFSDIFSTPLYSSLINMFDNSENPAVNNYLSLTRSFSPYQLNPMDMNPLREMVDNSVDFDLIEKKSTLKLFISATNVKTGKLRIFENHELSTDTLMASACLPTLHHAVEIDGESYWDGGFAGNPPVFPLIFNCKHDDIVIIMLQSLEIDETPKTADEIRDRAAELSFNSAFLREMRAISMSKQMLEKNWLKSGKLEGKLHDIYIHIIQNPELSSQHGPRSRYNTLPSFIELLHDKGYQSAKTWLENNFDKLGKTSTVDLQKMFI